MNKKDDSKHSFKGLDDWLEQFLDDPFTSVLDECSFHVELFETSEAYIIEADLPGFCREQLSIKTVENCVTIQAKSKGKPPEKTTITERSITLPFLLHNKIIKASYDQNILEITIKKHGKTTRNSNNVVIT